MNVINSASRFLVALLALLISVAANSQSQKLSSAADIQGHPAQKEIEYQASLIKERQKSKKFGYIRLSLQALDAPSVSIEIPGGEVVVIAKQSARSFPTYFAWFGRNEATGAELVLTISGGKAYGTLRTRTDNFTISYTLKEDLYLIADVDSGNGKKDHSGLPNMPAPAVLEKYEQDYQKKLKQERDTSKGKVGDNGQSTITPMVAGGVRIDLMVGYTAGARTYYGNNDAQVVSAVQAAVTQANQSFANSGVNVDLVLVDVRYYGVADSANHGAIKASFASRSDVQLVRNQVAADVAIVIAWPGTDECGEAYQGPNISQAFASVHVACLAAALSLPHEFGHLIGADHSIGAPQPPITSSGFAHGYPGTGDTPVVQVNGAPWYLCRHTIMASQRYLPPCTTTRFNYWSNPGVTVEGYFKIGNASANNAAVLNSNASTVAAFRTVPGGGGSGGSGGNQTAAAQQIIELLNLILNTPDS